LDLIIIPTEKNRGAQDCVDFRTISLVSHVSKIVLKILSHRLESTAQSYLGKDQFGYTKSHGTRDAIAALHVLYEKNLEYNNKVCVCKDWTKLMTMIENIGVDWKDRKLILNLYSKQVADVRMGDGLSSACTVGKG